MVLPVRIELTTSALPRMRSTTELRQQTRHVEAGARLWSEGVALVKARIAGDRCAMTENDDRAERLAAQLRENLKKRKARARGLADDASAAPLAQDAAAVVTDRVAADREK